jgi:predicted esterase
MQLALNKHHDLRIKENLMYHKGRIFVITGDSRDWVIGDLARKLYLEKAKYSQNNWYRSYPMGHFGSLPPEAQQEVNVFLQKPDPRQYVRIVA